MSEYLILVITRADFSMFAVSQRIGENKYFMLEVCKCGTGQGNKLQAAYFRDKHSQ